MGELQTVSLNEIRDFLKEYYGRKLQKTADLKESACCTIDTMSKHANVLQFIPQEVKEKYYGCGSPIPEDFLTLKGLTAVDLGCGAGCDSMILRFYLGPNGKMIGIDMTDEQLDVARRNGALFLKKLNYEPQSLTFVKDFIETCESIPDESADLVISNCVINLSPRKDLVFKAIHRILKPGGEFFIADVVSDRRNPHLANDPELVAECIGMAPYLNDAKDLMEEAGFRDARTYSISELAKSPRLKNEPAKFFKIVWRGFKLELDQRCEDYGQMALYKGNLPSSPTVFKLDNTHEFEAGRPIAVCRNTAHMLTQTRFARYFEVTSAIKHFGLFDCSPKTNTPSKTITNGCGPGCC